MHEHNEKLNLIEIYDKNIINFTSDTEFDKNKIQLGNLNTNEQIKATDEMIDFMNSGYKKENIDLNDQLFKFLKKKFNQKHRVNFSTNFLKENKLFFN